MKRWMCVASSVVCFACGEGANGAEPDANGTAPDTDADAAASADDADTSDAAEVGGYQWELPDSFSAPPPVPEDNPMSEVKVQLGRHLFYDKRLSGNGTQSCASCHKQALAFTDGRATGLGSTGESHPRGSMSLANIGYAASLTWANPDLLQLEDQALVPLFGVDPVELGANEEDLVAMLRADDTYQGMFTESFPDDADPFSIRNLTRAIAAFERTLISGTSPYDRYFTNGDEGALSDAAKRGASMVVDDLSNRFECNHCHGGNLFSSSVSHLKVVSGDAQFFNNGLYNLAGTSNYPATNIGKMEFTESPEDMGAFKPPTLRNIMLTAPYMHDGSAATIDDVIDHYARGGRNITSGPNYGDGKLSLLKDPLVHGFDLGSGSERGDLLAFLESLTDEEFIADPRHANPWPAGSPANGVASDE